jgi:hypothetical protein
MTYLLATRPVVATVLLSAALLVAQAVDTRQTPPISFGDNTAGIASTRLGGTLYLAVWSRPSAYWEQVEFFEVEKGKWLKLGTFKNDTYAWQSVASLPDGQLVGFVLRSEAGDYWYGSTKVFCIINGKAQAVYDNVMSTEIVDLNADGYPDLLASGWPDGDGGPSTTDVYVWKKSIYKKVLTVPFRSRYGLRVVKAISRFTTE